MASEIVFLLVGSLLIVIASSTKGLYGSMMLPLLAMGIFFALGGIGMLPLPSLTSLIIVFMVAFGFLSLARAKTTSFAANIIHFGLVFYIIMALVRGI